MLPRIKATKLALAVGIPLALTSFVFHVSTVPELTKNSYPQYVAPDESGVYIPSKAVEVAASEPIDANDSVGQHAHQHKTTVDDCVDLATSGLSCSEPQIDEYANTLPTELPEQPVTIDAPHNEQFKGESPNDASTAHTSDLEGLAPPTSTIKPESPKKLSHTVSDGDSLIGILKELGVSGSQINNVVFGASAPKGVFTLRKGSIIRVEMLGGSAEAVEILPSKRFYHRIELNSGRYSYEKVKHHKLVDSIEISMVVGTNFRQDVSKSNFSKIEAAMLRRVFEDKVSIDKLPRGSTVTAVFKRTLYDGAYFGDSDLTFAVIKSGEQRFDAYPWEEGGELSYYDRKGNNVSKTFRKHPIDDHRITSRYNPNRLHPVLKIVRPHRGTDYAGNRKPVLAIADGQIKYSGRKGSFGNTVIIKHHSGVQTLNAHLHKIAKGVKKGLSIKKNDIVGYIGSTGVVTGPHLHFEMKINGKYVDSLNSDLPTNERVSDQNIDKYLEHVKVINEQYRL